MYKEMETFLASQVLEILDGMTRQVVDTTISHEIAETPANVIELSAASSSYSGDIQRNDPCPCGSGKKWKNCGLKGTPEHQQRMAQKQGK